MLQFIYIVLAVSNLLSSCQPRSIKPKNPQKIVSEPESKKDKVIEKTSNQRDESLDSKLLNKLQESIRDLEIKLEATMVEKDTLSSAAADDKVSKQKILDLESKIDLLTIEKLALEEAADRQVKKGELDTLLDPDKTLWSDFKRSYSSQRILFKYSELKSLITELLAGDPRLKIGVVIEKDERKGSSANFKKEIEKFFLDAHKFSDSETFEYFTSTSRSDLYAVFLVPMDPIDSNKIPQAQSKLFSTLEQIYERST